jgi:predicted kinase
MDKPCNFLIQMSGPPGSGKSTLARLLARSIDGIVMNHDLIKAFFLESSHLPFQESAKLAYRLDWVLAEDMMQQGRSVVVDSVCNYDEVLERGTALARKYGYVYRYVECRVEDLDLLNRRLRARISLRSQRTGVNKPPLDSASNATETDEDSAALFRKWMNPRRPGDAKVLIVVDSTHPPEECLQSVLKQLGFRPDERLQGHSESP